MTRRPDRTGAERASNSLQLDEIIALYVGKIMNDPLPVALVHNHHPMVSRSTLEVGSRLTLHGLDSETLHGHLRKLKAEAKREAVRGKR
ncbi:DUF6999 family protein [Sorangium sp. So ce363]|uniref:DUF6999 family protein n=1 Tax=Sorangium sp. So ce363 TaxID=3133304 RepID=UPI003F5E05AF